MGYSSRLEFEVRNSTGESLGEGSSSVPIGGMCTKTSIPIELESDIEEIIKNRFSFLRFDTWYSLPDGYSVRFF